MHSEWIPKDLANQILLYTLYFVYCVNCVVKKIQIEKRGIPRLPLDIHAFIRKANFFSSRINIIFAKINLKASYYILSRIKVFVCKTFLNSKGQWQGSMSKQNLGIIYVINVYHKNSIGASQGELENPLSYGFFTQITPRKCLKFMFTPSLPNNAGCQIDHSRNNAIFPSNSRFRALKYIK